MMSRKMPIMLLLFGLMANSISIASTVVGRVMNLSTNQPAYGDEVILYRVDRTMHEVARTTSDRSGAFRFEGWDRAAYIVAVKHQKVSYHTRQLTGTAPIEINIYDSAPKVAQIQESSDTLFPQVDGNTLKVSEFFVLVNSSAPPRTLSGQQTFQFQLPPGATLESVAVQPPGTLPFLAKATACGSPDQYCLDSPIRPGTTKIRAQYALPLAEEVSITKPALRSVNEVAVLTPALLRFESSTHSFIDRGQQDGLSLHLANGIRAGQTISFRLSRNEIAKAASGALDVKLTRTLPLAASQVPSSSRIQTDRLWTILTLALVGAGVVGVAYLKVGKAAHINRR